MPKIDRKTFNDDPKHEGARNEFDGMVADSLARIKAQQDKTKPPQEKGFIEEVLDGMGLNIFDSEKPK